MKAAWKHWPLAAWAAYLIVPAPGWGLFSGRPLGLLGLVALSLGGLLWAVRRRIAFAPVVAAAIAVKLGCAPLLVERGFAARYYATADFSGPVESGSERRAPGRTRVDSRLQFGGSASADLPLHFFNDATRFNFYVPGQPVREKLAFSIVWEGHVDGGAGGRRSIYVRAPGMTTTIAIGDDEAVVAPPAASDWRSDVVVPPGWQRLRIAVSAPYGAERRFEAGWIRGGAQMPFDDRDVVVRPVSPARLILDRILRVVSRLFDTLLLVTLLGSAASVVAAAVRDVRAHDDRPRAIASWSTLIAAFAIADAAVFALPTVDRTVMLSGGDDWLAYEMMAREILLNGPLMLFGTEIGHGFGYYWHPFYPYFLAACHWLTGDGLFGIYFVQRFLFGLTVVMLGRMTDSLFGFETGRAGFAVALVLVYERIGHWANYLLSDVVFIPLMVGWTFVMVRQLRRTDLRARDGVGAGILWGCATLARGTPLLGIGLVLPFYARACARRFGRWARPTAVMLAAMLAVTLTATARNYYVARKFIPIFTSGANSLIIGNPPPPSVQLGSGPRDWIYHRLNVDPPTRSVAEFAIQQPAVFVNGLARKVWYMLGWFDTLRPGVGRALFLMACWMTAAAGLVWMAFGRASREGMPGARLIPLAVASVHVAAMIVVFPHVYGDRLILPIYALIVPYAAVAVAAACRALTRVSRELLRQIALCAAFVFCGGQAATGWFAFDFDMFAPLLILASVALGEPLKRSSSVWIPAALALALSASLLLAPSPAAAEEFRRQIAFVALIPVVASLAAFSATRRAGVAVLLSALAVAAAASKSWASVRALNDTVTLYLMTWVTRAPALSGGDWWFGRGLAAPADLVDAGILGLGAGGWTTWTLLSTGVVGASLFALLWTRALWRTGRRLNDWAAVALSGGIIAMLVFSQSKNLLGGPSAIPAVAALAGMMLGLAETDGHVPAE